MDRELISVIVPVYNTEKYLDTCVESLVKQTYEDIEILLMDDGSTDSCKEKCDEWAKRDARIRVIHKQNEGLAETRNRGLKEAKGKYIAWVDSDDYVDETFLKVLYEQLVKNEADISMCSFYDVRGEELLFEAATRIYNASYSAGEFMEKIYTVGAFSVVWNKLAKKETYNGVVYPKGRRFEDSATMRALTENCKKIVVCDIPLYFYRRHAESITKKEKSAREMAAYLHEFCQWLEEDIEVYQRKNNARLRFLASKHLCAAIILHYGELEKADKKVFKEKYNRYVKNILGEKDCTIKVKAKYTVAYWNIGLYRFLRKMANVKFAKVS